MKRGFPVLLKRSVVWLLVSAVVAISAVSGAAWAASAGQPGVRKAVATFVVGTREDQQPGCTGVSGQQYTQESVHFTGREISPRRSLQGHLDVRLMGVYRRNGDAVHPGVVTGAMTLRNAGTGQIKFRGRVTGAGFPYGQGRGLLTAHFYSDGRETSRILIANIEWDYRRNLSGTITGIEGMLGSDAPTAPDFAIMWNQKNCF